MALGFGLALLLVPSGYFAWRFRTMPQLGSWHDDAIYWISAQSLAQQQGYAIGHLPTRPAQTKYPPLYPALLSLVWRFGGPFPGNLTAATALQWSFAPLHFVLAWFWFLRCGFRAWPSWALTVLVAAAPITTLFAVSLMTELPFTAVLLALMLVIEGREVSSRRGLVAGVLGAAAFLIRTNAIMLAVGVPLLLVLRRRYRQALAFLAPMLVAIAGWQTWCATRAFHARDDITAYYTSYAAFYAHTFSWADLPHRVWTNADAIIESLARLVLFHSGDEPWLRAVSWVITAAAAAGVVTLFRWGVRYYPVFAALLVAVLLLWQYPPDQRFVYPLFPLYLAGLATKLTEVAGLAVRSWRTASGANRIAAVPVLLAIAALAAGSLWSTTEGTLVLLPKYFGERQSQLIRLQPAWQWIVANTPTAARFAAYDDTLLYLYAGRRGYTEPILPGVVYGSEDVPSCIAGLPALWSQVGVTHVLFTEYDFLRDFHEPGHDALAGLLADQRRFRLLYSDGAARVYGVASSNR
ncbi:MAG: hypothetical protein ABSH47_10415 [Bryobacteraceae bacterium]